MDAIISIFAMPIGVTICFGPAIVVWWLMEGRFEKQKQNEALKK